MRTSGLRRASSLAGIACLASLAAVALCTLTACSSARSHGADDVESRAMARPQETRAPAQAPTGAASAPPATLTRGPLDVESLARQTGLTVEDQRNSVLLCGATRARFFPNSDRMCIDGTFSSMGEPARRGEVGFVIPAAGVDAVHKAVDKARSRPEIPIVTFKPLDVPKPGISIPTAKPIATRGPVGGDPAWGQFVGAERDWRWIVVHHSDDDSGCCAKYDEVHRRKGWDCCGYDFVIGNGTMSGDGQIEVGPRWLMQQTGAHAKTPDNRYNEYGVGIVLVGDFEHGCGPTSRQYASLVRLTKWLMARYHIAPHDVLRHEDCKPTACPGRNFPWARYIADVSR